MSLVASLRSRRRIAALAVAALALGGVAAVGAASPAGASTSGLTTHYAVVEPGCVTPTDPATNRCFAERRVAASRSTPGARAYVTSNATTFGPMGGLTPALLAGAYGYNPASSTTQKVGIVDWYDDPTALADLDKFDEEYSLPDETSSSFVKVNENGQASPLPTSVGSDAQASSVEIALDIESVRSVCNKCQVILVEARTGNDADLATAVDTAATLGATEISNSWGEPEQYEPANSPLYTAFSSHPGVVITASTGDNGWHDWDYPFYGEAVTASTTVNYPSSDPSVIAVGGTTLNLSKTDGTRISETVWNGNGPAASTYLNGDGATGGGCSSLFAAKSWQTGLTNYAATGCNGKRSGMDIAAVGDPMTGLDIYDTSAPVSYKPGWMTIGGTSLASPVVAAMWALAGGSGGVTSPASTLYANAARNPSLVHDVTSGGNGFCGGDAHCSADTASETGGTNNPNALGRGIVDCSFPASGQVTAEPAASLQCNSATGYDGASGLGTPDGLGIFSAPVTPKPPVTTPKPPVATPKPPTIKVAHGNPAKLKIAVSAKSVEPTAGIKPTSYTWTFGDGHTAVTKSASTSVATSHTYAKKGTYKITVKIADSAGHSASASTSVKLGYGPTVTYKAPSKPKHKHSAAFSAKGSHVNNTGAHITKITWNFGDKHTATATSTKHTYAKAGTYTVTVVVLDSTGESTTSKHKVKVK